MARPTPGWLIPLVVASGLLMDLMDSTALATALPTLAEAFAVPPLHMKLALTAYLMTAAVFVPASAWFMGRFGAKRVFIVAMCLFMTGSALCGISNSLEQLVAARVLQGIGGAMMTPVGRSLVVSSSDRAHLVKAIAWFTMPAIIGPLLGPPLAGVLIEHASWRWIFFINIPIGVVGLIATAVFVPLTSGTSQARFDFSGFLQIALCLALFLTAESATMFSGPLRWALAAGGVLAAWSYARHAFRHPDPVIDLRLFRHATLRASLLIGWLTRFSAGALPFLLPLLLQVAMGISPLTATIVMTSMAVGALFSRFLVPPLTRHLGFKRALLGLGIGTTVFAALPASFTGTTPLALIGLVMGLGSVLRASMLMSTTTLAYADVEPEEIGHASVLHAMGQYLSLGVGVSFAAWLLTFTSDGVALQPSYFVVPFLVIAMVGALSLIAIVRMDPNAAASLRPGARA